MSIVVCAVLFVLFAVMAWQFWRGRWLNLIAGNNFVTDEEMKSPYQRALGRRMAVVCLLACGSILIGLFAVAVVPLVCGPDADMVRGILIAVSALVIAIPCIWVVVWANTQGKRYEDDSEGDR